MANCIYKCSNEGICCCSSSEYHCKVVSDEICSKCELIQDKIIKSAKQHLTSVIRAALDALPNIPGNDEVIGILSNGLRQTPE